MDSDEDEALAGGPAGSPMWAVEEVSFEGDSGEIDEDVVKPLGPGRERDDFGGLVARSEAVAWGEVDLDADAGEISALDVSIDHVSAYDSDSEVFLEQLNMLSLNDHDDDDDDDDDDNDDETANKDRAKGQMQAVNLIDRRGGAASSAGHFMPHHHQAPHAASRKCRSATNGPAQIRERITQTPKPAVAVLNPFYNPIREHFPPWDEAFFEVRHESLSDDPLKPNGDLDLSIDTMAVINADVFDGYTPVKCVNPPSMLHNPTAAALESNLPIEHLRTPFGDNILPPSGRKVRRTLRGSARDDVATPVSARRTGAAMFTQTPGTLLSPETPTPADQLCMADLYSRALAADLSSWPTPMSQASSAYRAPRSPASFMVDEPSPIPTSRPSGASTNTQRFASPPSASRFYSMSSSNASGFTPSMVSPPAGVQSSSPSVTRRFSSAEGPPQWSTPVGERAAAIVSSVESCLGRQLRQTPTRRRYSHHYSPLDSPWS